MINDVKLYPTVYCRIYCRKILTLSIQTSHYESKHVRKVNFMCRGHLCLTNTSLVFLVVLDVGL